MPQPLSARLTGVFICAKKNIYAFLVKVLDKYAGKDYFCGIKSLKNN
jgi:hypothetical protein